MFVVYKNSSLTDFWSQVEVRNDTIHSHSLHPHLFPSRVLARKPRPTSLSRWCSCIWVDYILVLSTAPLTESAEWASWRTTTAAKSYWSTFLGWLINETNQLLPICFISGTLAWSLRHPLTIQKWRYQRLRGKCNPREVAEKFHESRS